MLFKRFKDLKAQADLTAAHDVAHGWYEAKDGTYTSGSPLQLLADTATILPNDNTLGVKSYAPDGITLFENGKISGRNGEGLIITSEFKAKPTNAGTTYIETWLDIGGGIPPLYTRIISFPKGNGIERNITSTTFAYTLDTWEANGGTIKVKANNTCDVYDIRCVIGTAFPVIV